MWGNIVSPIITPAIKCDMKFEIIYPFPNFNNAAVEVWEWIINLSHTLLDMWKLILVVIPYF